MQPVKLTDIITNEEFLGDWNGSTFTSASDISDLPKRFKVERDETSCDYNSCQTDFCFNLLINRKGVYFKDDDPRYWYDTELIG